MIKSVIDELYEYARERTGSERIKKAIIGAGYTFVELDDGRGGIAYTNLEGGISRGLPGKIRGMRASEAIGYLLSGRGQEVSLGLATVNAVLNNDVEGLVEADALEQASFGPDDTVVFVGYFCTYIRLLKEKVRRIIVLELMEVASSDAQVYPWWAYSTVFKEADKLFITGTSIVNHTINYLLPASKHIFDKHILGPSTPLAPEVFKRYNVRSLNASIVVDNQSCANVIMEGGGVKELYAAGCLRKVSMIL